MNPRVLEELGTIVKDEIDTGQLLKGLKTTSSQEPLDHLWGETIGIGGFAKRQFVLVDSLDLIKFGDKSRVVNRESTKTAHRLCGTLPVILLDKVPRSLREKPHTTRQDDGPEELDGKRNTVRAGVVAVVGTLVNTSGQKQTDGDRQLVASNNCSSDPFGRRLRLVHRD